VEEGGARVRLEVGLEGSPRPASGVWRLGRVWKASLFAKIGIDVMVRGLWKTRRLATASEANAKIEVERCVGEEDLGSAN
jgi:hypothetical protein